MSDGDIGDDWPTDHGSPEATASVRSTGSALPPVSRPDDALRGALENIYYGWLDLAAERFLAGKPAPTTAEAANAFAYYAAPLVRAALRAGPTNESAEGLSVICRQCGTLVSGVEAGDRVQWVTCQGCGRAGPPGDEQNAQR